MRNDLGESFHPNLFFEWLPGSSVSSMFKWMLDNKDKVKETFRMQVTENGYIKLTGTVKSDDNGKNLPLTEYYIKGG